MTYDPRLAEIWRDIAELQSESFFVDCLKLANTDDELRQAIEIVRAQYKDNPAGVERQVGKKLVEKCKNYALYC